MSFYQRWCSRVLVSFIIGAGLGCGDKPVQVEGIVTLDDKPVEGASVFFIPEGNRGRTAIVQTDANGVFHQMTFPGEYKVTLSKILNRNPKYNPEDPKAMEEYHKMMTGNTDAPHLKNRNQLPASYADEAKPMFRFSVPDTKKLILELKKT